MKTNNQQTLLYDDNCPLCAAYTKAFIKTGLLQQENRIAFSSINIHEFKMDVNRARHEIPLINLQTGEVKYGINALAEILNQKLPFVKPVLGISWVHWFFKKLYSFISYNRKIIIAKPSFAKSCFDCSPDYSLKHRIALVLFTWILSICLLLQGLRLYFLPINTAWFLGCFVAPMVFIAGKTKQHAADILVHLGITMLLSTIIFSISSKIFSGLFTSSTLVIVVSLVMTTVVFVQQCTRRIQFYIREQIL